MILQEKNFIGLEPVIERSAPAADIFLPVVRTGKRNPTHPVNPVRKK